MRTVALHAGVDADLPHVREADEVVALPSPAGYRDVDAVISAARSTGAEAVHPGYGFLSESLALARACTKAGLLWVGPAPESMELLADKVAARNHVAARGVPVLPGTPDAVAGPDEAMAATRRIGYPLWSRRPPGAVRARRVPRQRAEMQPGVSGGGHRLSRVRLGQLRHGNCGPARRVAATVIEGETWPRSEPRWWRTS